MVDFEDLGRRLRLYREEKGMNQSQMAKKLGVCASFEGHLERGTRKASLETLVTISNVTGLSTDYLLAASLDRLCLTKTAGLTKKQRLAMHEILYKLRDQLVYWDDIAEDDDEDEVPEGQDNI